MSQKLKGLVGQNMRGQRRSLTAVCKSYAAGSYTFTPAKSGWYRMVGWGAGSTGYQAGGICGSSGAHFNVVRYLSANIPVTISVGATGTFGSGADGSPTSITLRDGEVLTATGGGYLGSAGVASTNRQVQPADVFLNGAIGTSGSPGTGPSSPDFPGGSGGASPGSGGRLNSGSTGTCEGGGDGQAILLQVRMGTP